MTNKIHEDKNIDTADDMIDIPADATLSAQQQALIESLDKESATRKLGDGVGKALYWLAVIVSLYHLYTAAFGPPLTLKHRSLHVAMMLALTFIMYPFSAKSKFKRVVAWYDWILVALSFAAPVYV